MFLSAEELRTRVDELGAQIAEDYAGKELLLISILKASVVFLTDLSRAIPSTHKVDFVELAGYNGADTGGHSRVRLLKDTIIPLAGHDVLIVDEVVDTGLTLNYLRGLFELRNPESLRVGRAARPALPAVGRRPARGLCRLHRPGRVLRRVRIRHRRALAQPARPAARQSLGTPNFR